jgi:hypothetical protein
MSDDDLARLDTDWSGFPENEQAAFALARKLTLAPGSLTDADIDECLAHFSGKEILEMALSVGGNNAINRWKEGIGVAQAGNGGNSGWAQAVSNGVHSYLTPTANRFDTIASAVAILSSAKPGDDLVATASPLPLASAEEIAVGLATARSRSARLPLVDETEARRVLGDLAPAGALPHWVRLLAHFPLAGSRMVKAFELTAEASGLSPVDRARIAWTVARRNRAWYALGMAEECLRSSGADDATLADLAGDQRQLSAAERAVLVVADRLAASPVACTDADFETALEATSPATMVQVVHAVAMQSLFDRFTEAAGLTLE